MEYRVLLYYYYTDIVDPDGLSKEHLRICKDMNLKGRILIAHEGINGTVSGTVEDTDKMPQAGNHPYSGMAFKVDEETDTHLRNMLTASLFVNLLRRHQPHEIQSIITG